MFLFGLIVNISSIINRAALSRQRDSVRFGIRRIGTVCKLGSKRIVTPAFTTEEPWEAKLESGSLPLPAKGSENGEKTSTLPTLRQPCLTLDMKKEQGAKFSSFSRFDQILE